MSAPTTEFSNHVSWVEAPVDPMVPTTCPQDDAAKVAIVTLHDGGFAPRRILEAPNLAAVASDGALERSFRVKRDWGASLLSGHLAAALGTGGFHRVNVSRLVMDFNRFPGSTPYGASHLDKLAISGYLARDLNHTDKRWILEEFYDPISTQMDEVISDKRARKYWDLAQIAELNGDWNGVVMNVQFALTYEKENPILKQKLEAAKVKMREKNKKDKNPYKIKIV